MLGLPNEILKYIFNYLDYSDYIIIQYTCKLYKTLFFELFNSKIKFTNRYLDYCSIRKIDEYALIYALQNKIIYPKYTHYGLGFIIDINKIYLSVYVLHQTDFLSLSKCIILIEKLSKLQKHPLYNILICKLIERSLIDFQIDLP